MPFNKSPPELENNPLETVIEGILTLKYTFHMSFLGGVFC